MNGIMNASGSRAFPAPSHRLSGSGKTTLIRHVLANAQAAALPSSSTNSATSFLH